MPSIATATLDVLMGGCPCRSRDLYAMAGASKSVLALLMWASA